MRQAFGISQVYLEEACLRLPKDSQPTIDSQMQFCSYQIQHLVLGGTTLRELKSNTTTCESSVDFRVGIESVINTSLLLLVQNNLENLATVLLGAETLANNLNWEDEIGEDGVVDSSECSGTGSLLSLRCTGAVGALWAGKNAARGEDEDVTVGELLLELTGETACALDPILFNHGEILGG